MFKNMTIKIKHRLYSSWVKLINPLIIRKVKAREEKMLVEMGLTRKQAVALIQYAMFYQLIEEGLGQLVWRTAKVQKITPLEAGRRLSEGFYWYEWCVKIASEQRIK